MDGVIDQVTELLHTRGLAWEDVILRAELALP
jgi:hypothetical protein